jgi:hypothetical protein
MMILENQELKGKKSSHNGLYNGRISAVYISRNCEETYFCRKFGLYT